MVDAPSAQETPAKLDASEVLSEIDKLTKALAPATAPAATPSPRFSLRGWSPATWLAKNKEWVKWLMTTESGLLGLQTLSQQQVPVIAGHELQVAAVLAGLGLVKLLFDVGDYFLTANPQ
jgi:hypothetical protein